MIIIICTDAQIPVPVWGILIFHNSSLVILSLVFHSSLKPCCPLGSSYFGGKSVKYRVIEFVVFGYDSLPYLLSLFSGLGNFSFSCSMKF